MRLDPDLVARDHAELTHRVARALSLPDEPAGYASLIVDAAEGAMRAFPEADA